ncbi:hypothetical protein H0H81_009330 [Sphagnurus paluster]|uniref:Peroxisomal biogenesis factor 3 n=1 Tax=Sphagnurus paluster TaxID=117069 RepID=A0A9P7K4M0_9AGAR|nr:hypothetical protein H0H81_009330 [Sphagnurus paluster]
MLTTLKNFVADRRSGLSKVATVVGGVYVVRSYIHDRLEEVKERLEEERIARETYAPIALSNRSTDGQSSSLHNRFNKNQEDASFIILGLMQMLSEQISSGMDVEGLTVELQARSKARHAARTSQIRPPSSLASSVDMLQEQDTRSDTGSAVISVASTSYHEATTSDMSTSGLQSWVETPGETGPSSEPRTNQAVEETEIFREKLAPSNVTNTEGSSVADSALVRILSSSITSSVSAMMTTAELWNEVKILTFTRTLTTLYTLTLLALLTNIQFTLLARAKYIHHMRERARAEAFSIGDILFGGDMDIEALLSGGKSSWGGQDAQDEEEQITDDVESRFLTMSWWILHMGWKDIGERVRRAVEEVFEGVSLKSKLSPGDVHRLLQDLRKRVEFPEDKPTSFLSALLPPTPETVQHVLMENGFASSSTHPYTDLLEFDFQSPQNSGFLPPLTSHLHRGQIQPRAFTALLDETRATLASPDFAIVLQRALDAAAGQLWLGVEREVWGSSATGSSRVEEMDEEKERMRLAGMLPGVARWSRLALDGVPSVVVDNVFALREVQCLSAIVFAKFEERMPR